jgi:hypothetical protein
VGLERGPLSLMSTNEELLERKSSYSGLDPLDYGRGGSGALTTRHPTNGKSLALTSSTSGGRSVGMIRSWCKTTELLLLLAIIIHTGMIASTCFNL